MNTVKNNRHPAMPFLSILAGFSLIVFCTAAQAQSAPPDEWEFELTPYLWLAGLDGTLSVGEREAEVSASFSDLLESLDFGAMGEFEARKEKWSLSTNVVYTDLGKEAELQGPQGAPLGAVSVDLDMLIADAQVGYRLGASAADVLAGARVFSVDSRIDGPLRTLASGGATWVDPFIGLRLKRWFAGDKWQVALQGDIGGFGAGSDFSWGASAGFGYRLNRTISLHAIYRALSFDYEGGREIGKLDSTLGGFGAAVTLHF